MSEKKPQLREGRLGAALAIRVIPHAKQNEVVEIMNDGAIKIHLTAGGESDLLNQTLVSYLAQILGVPSANVEVIAGKTSSNKLVSVIDMSSDAVTQKIIAGLS